jgi:hypothetical protein
MALLLLVTNIFSNDDLTILAPNQKKLIIIDPRLETKSKLNEEKPEPTPIAICVKNSLINRMGKKYPIFLQDSYQANNCLR